MALLGVDLSIVTLMINMHLRGLQKRRPVYYMWSTTNCPGVLGQKLPLMESIWMHDNHGRLLDRKIWMRPSSVRNFISVGSS